MVLVLDTPQAFSDLYRARLEPWLTQDLGLYASAIGAMFEQVYALVSDRGADGEDDYRPGWGSLLDVDRCPGWALPYLGQFVGVLNLRGVGDSESRALIRGQTAAHRGTPQSIVASAKSTLTGTQSLLLAERFGGDPYQILVVTFAAETPDQALTLDAIERVKPAGILLTFIVADGWLIGQMETFFAGDTIATVEGTYTSLVHYESQITG